MLSVAIVGKPNVGKSTLFNRIIQQKKAIVHNQPGVTRDRIEQEAQWLNHRFTLIDTGGLTNQNISFRQNIENQVTYAINQADLILFVVSAKEGINNEDYYVAKFLKKYRGKNIILIANKTENNSIDNLNIYYSLGFGKPIYASAEHGIGIGDLLDDIIKYDTHNQVLDIINHKPIAFCLIGRTNVGKSTLVNTILQQERMMVSPIPHTTRDSVDTTFTYQQQIYTIIDTAGIRRKGKITDNIEKYAVLRSQQAIKRSNIIILLLDGSQPFNEQDEIIGGLAYKANIPTVICVNKWDQVKKDNNTMVEMTRTLRQRLKYLSWAPIIYVSGLKKQRVDEIFKQINIINKQLQIHVNSSLLNDVIAKAQIATPPPKYRGGRIDLVSAMQTNSQIPTFILYGNDPKYVHLSYSRYLENQIREAFGITNVPITLYFKDKNARNRGFTKKN